MAVKGQAGGERNDDISTAKKQAGRRFYSI